MCNNPTLTNLAGLESLTYIGGEFWIQNNQQLEDISSLSSLNEVGEIMGVIYNSSLCCLSGLDNINPESIMNLIIHNNSVLTFCAIESICDYLVVPAGDVEIHDNAAGCSGIEEVETICNVIPSIEVLNVNIDIIFSPNPTAGKTSLQIVNGDNEIVICELFNHAGIKVKSILVNEKIPEDYKIEIDLTNFPAGAYFCTLKTNKEIQVEKLMKLE